MRRAPVLWINRVDATFSGEQPKKTDSSVEASAIVAVARRRSETPEVSPRYLQRK